MSDLLGERVRLDLDGPVATLTLARPDAGNALDLAMALALEEAVSRLAASPGLRAVRVAAQGRAFCVGGDLREFAGLEDPASHVAEVARAAHAALTGLRELPVPLVVVVQGVAAGGGIGVALVGDLVLVARSVLFRVAYTAAGLSPDCGVSYHLSRSLGPAVAADLALTNRPLPAQEALAAGLVSRVVADADLVGEADGVLDGLAAGAPQALAATRYLLRAHDDRAWRQHLHEEAESIARLAGTADGREGIAAFLARRPARYTG